MKRLVALAMLLAVALAAPGAQSAGSGTKVKFSAWELRTGGKTAKVSPGGTYAHCPGRHPGRILVRGRMSRPAAKGQAFVVRFMVAHIVIHGSHGTTGNGGKLKGIIHGGGGPLPDGTWTATAMHDGKRVGRSRIHVVSRQSACG